MSLDFRAVFWLLAVLAPFVTFGIVRRLRKRTGGLAWSIGLIGSSIVSWLFLIAGEYAKSVRLQSAYELTKDEAILRRLVNDTSSVMLIHFGCLLTLFWSINVFGILAIIGHFRRRSRLRTNLAVQSLPTLRQQALSVQPRSAPPGESPGDSPR
jgi:hypothetical protein